MGCDCDKKPELPKADKCGDMTPAILEVNNPSEVIMFHKVIIPASMGDETEYPALNGLYKNVLMVYAANGHAYLYSSDGVPTYISFDTGGVLTVETLPEPSQATRGFLYVTETGSMYVTLDGENWITLSTGASPEFDSLSNRPKYAGVEMTSDTDIPSVEQLRADMESLFATERETRETADDALSTAIEDEAQARATADTTLQGNIDAEVDARSNADTALSQSINAIDTAINKTVMTDLAVNSNASTSVVQLDATKTNIKTSSTTTNNIPLPVASATQAGVMNSATFNAIAQNTQDIANIKGEVVAISNLPANPTQQELTTAWLNTSGEPALINGAGIYDVTNAKRWTYYSNDTTWHSLDASGSVTVNTWTNSAAGIVKGSTAIGQIFAESDGTGSVNGWDTLSAQVSDNTSKLTTIQQGAEVNVQSDWAQTDAAADDYIKNKPAINDATLTIQRNGTNVATFTANSATNATANIAVPTATSDLTNDSDFISEGTVLSPVSAVAYVGTANIIDGAVTPKKLSGTFWYSATNGNPVTITKGGVYDISAQLSNLGTTGGLYIQVQSSGSSSWTTVSSAYSAATVWNGISVRKIIALNANDKVRVTFNNNVIQADQAYNQFNIVEVLGAN